MYIRVNVGFVLVVVLGVSLAMATIAHALYATARRNDLSSIVHLLDAVLYAFALLAVVLLTS